VVKEKKEKVTKIKKYPTINFDLINVEKKFITLSFD